MAQSSKTFPVFVSSTFSDLKAERNALQAYVFLRLRELCEQHGSRFQPIDLRWGVSDEASLDQQAMDICLGDAAAVSGRSGGLGIARPSPGTGLPRFCTDTWR